MRLRHQSPRWNNKQQGRIGEEEHTVMTTIAENIKALGSELPEGVKLIAVSKNHPSDAIMEAYAAGQRRFGENRVQEMTAKHEVLPKDIEWHLIGHLQTNKVKYIAPYVYMIHSIDSFKLLQEVNKQAEKAGRTIKCLLQIHIAKEETKFGFSPDECRHMLAEEPWQELRHVSICGLMGVATNTDDTSQVKSEFLSLQQLAAELKAGPMNNADFCELSMGMTHDYQLALDYGSTMVRIGTKIFGERDYSQRLY